MKKVWILMIVALVALVSCASAETLTGTLSQTEWNQTIWGSTKVAGTYMPFEALGFYYIEQSTNAVSLVRWEDHLGTIDAGAPSGTSIPCVLRYSSAGPNASGYIPDGPTGKSGPVVGTCTLGFQRFFTEAGAETTGGYQYLVFNDGITLPLGVTGTGHLYVEYDHSAFYNKTFYQIVGAPSPTPGIACFEGNMNAANLQCAGSVTGTGWLFSRDIGGEFSYSATKPSGIGITGSVAKVSGSTRAYIYNGTSGAVISNEAVYSSSGIYNFSTAASTIIIGMKISGGSQVNSSVLFSTAAPTPTPTATPPIGPDNPIPYGYVRSMAQCVDGQSSGTIHECQISLKDVENGTWSNGTYYGTWWIDTLPTHTIDAYGSATGYSSVSRTGLLASGTKMYELLMWPSYIPAPTAGSVNFYVIVNDAASGLALPTASVRVVDSSTGITHVRQTGTNGVGSFVVTNSTLMHVTVSKTGYIDATATMTTTAAGPDTLRVELLKAVVTTAPTNTIPPGGVTTAVTLDSRTSEQKATGAMNILYDNGENIIGVCVLVTILGLLGVRLGK